MGALVVSPPREAIYSTVARLHAGAGEHAPFWDMERAVPKLRPHKSDRIPFPFANDALAEAVVAASKREYDSEFKAIKHRAALVIGESALFASLPHIPEETIFWADNSRGMLRFEGQYRDISRSAPLNSEWQTRIFHAVQTITSASDKGISAQKEVFEAQVGNWSDAGFGHPSRDKLVHEQCQYFAKNKAIVPFPIDIFDERDVARLSRICRLGNISITYVNITNVCEYGGTGNPEAMLPILESLPLADSGTILSTTTESSDTNGLFCQEGPFYGLDNYGQRFGGFGPK